MKIDETKDKILNVAATIFSKFGFHKTTVDEIARAAHKAKGSVYYHFKSKEELFQGVVDEKFQMLRGELIKAKLYSYLRNMFLRIILLKETNCIKNFSKSIIQYES